MPKSRIHRAKPIAARYPRRIRSASRGMQGIAMRPIAPLRQRDGCPVSAWSSRDRVPGLPSRGSTEASNRCAALRRVRWGRVHARRVAHEVATGRDGLQDLFGHPTAGFAHPVGHRRDGTERIGAEPGQVSAREMRPLCNKGPRGFPPAKAGLAKRGGAPVFSFCGYISAEPDTGWNDPPDRFLRAGRRALRRFATPPTSFTSSATTSVAGWAATIFRFSPLALTGLRPRASALPARFVRRPLAAHSERVR